jgi:DtxR family transcriptional regulator, Mn-dependent transcriptional regulator
MGNPPVTRAAEDYLKAILELESPDGVSTGTLAGHLGLSQPSVTRMTQKLERDGLVSRVPYRGVTLTDTGRRVALEVLRHHRLLELFLAKNLGLPLDEVHAEADRLEHVLSEELEARMDAALGYPTHDPHGHPIPDTELRLDTAANRSLSEVAAGESATVLRVPDRDSELLRYLGELKLVPGATVEVVAHGPFDGPVTLRSQTGEHAIARELAVAIAVA